MSDRPLCESLVVGTQGNATIQLDRTLSKAMQWTQVARHCQFNLCKVAEFFGVTPRQIERWCQYDLGRAPAEWLLEQRILAAEWLLRSKSIKEVTYELGFRQASHFSRCFKAIIGVTAKDYRARFQR